MNPYHPGDPAQLYPCAYLCSLLTLRSHLPVDPDLDFNLQASVLSRLVVLHSCQRSQGQDGGGQEV